MYCFFYESEALHYIHNFLVKVQGLLFCIEYSYQTSFGQKYDHFSLLCKQVYIVRKVNSAPTLLA